MNHINHYYDILGLNPGASLEAVKQAYRDLAMVWHPDRFPNNPRLKEKAQEELKRINQAYDMLKTCHCSSSTRTTPANPQPSSSADAKTYYELAMEKARRGRYKEAIEYFNYALRISPRYAQAYEYRGLAYYKLGDRHKATENFSKAANIYLNQWKIGKYQDVVDRMIQLQIA